VTANSTIIKKINIVMVIAIKSHEYLIITALGKHIPTDDITPNQDREDGLRAKYNC
tara:strand:- start:58 stop:225 length:168 start_codon:yes stop_codon:yes gene_type:complete